MSYTEDESKMILRERPTSRHRGDSPRRLHAKPVVAGATVLALGLSGVFLTGGAANAAVGSSNSSARYLSGGLLGNSLDGVAKLTGENAKAGADTEKVVTNSGDLDLSALQESVDLQVADGVTIPLTVTDAGVLSQYATASQNGNSNSSSGLITNDGAIDVDRTDAAPQRLSLDLRNLIGDDLSGSVSDVTLTTGVNTASASGAPGKDPVGDYRVGDLRATFTSPVIAGLSDDLVTAGAGVQDTVNGVFGADGSVASGITDAVSSLGVADVDTSIDVDLAPVIQDVIQRNTVLGADGPVTVNLNTGVVTVDIAAVLEANGRDLNDLEPGEDVLNSDLVGFITDDVNELVNGFLDEAQEAVSTTLQAATVNVSATVGDAANPDLTLTLNGTLQEIAAGDAVPVITVTDESYDVAPLNALLSGSVNTALNARIDTGVIDDALSALYPNVDTALTTLVRLQANVQETTEEEFSETALRLTVLTIPDTFVVMADAPSGLTLNLAQAAVGPNVAPTADETVPNVVGITPTSGPEAGGTAVTITGSGFTDATGVTFDGNDATDFTVVSDTEITATTPAGVGTVDVTVNKAGGVEGTLTNAFTYVPAGDGDGVISINPTSGPEAGGTAVTITGRGFTDATAVNFGDNAGTDFTVVSDTEITVNTPAGVGTVPVTVTTPDGVLSSPTDFTYVPAGNTAPAITDVNPSSGPESGFTIVTITGNGFTGATGVNFGGKDAFSYTVDSDTQITAVTPAGVGTVPVTVTVDGDVVASPIPFTYVPVTPAAAPTVDSVTPNTGSTNGGTTVTIIGSGFTDGDEVFFDGKPATNVTVVNDTTITATTPAGTAGPVDVTVTTPGGQQGQLDDGFTYVQEPTSGNPGGNPGDGNGTDPGDGNGGTTDPGNGDNGNGVGDNGVTNGDGNTGGTGISTDDGNYANCEVAAADGKVNFPSSNRNLDRDNDGIACENGEGAADNGPSGLAYTGSTVGFGTAAAAVLMILTGAGFLVRRRLLG